MLFLRDIAKIKLRGGRKWGIERGVPALPDTQRPDLVVNAGRLEDGAYDRTILIREMGRARKVTEITSEAV